MDWVKLAIPLIAVAVWILSNLANQQKETRRPPRPTPPRDPLDAAVPNPKSKSEEDDRYRLDMERKREKVLTVAKPFPRPRVKRLESVSRPPPLPVVLPPVSPPVLPSRRGDRDQTTKAAMDPYLAVPIVLAAEPVPLLGAAAVPAAKPAPVVIKNMLELLKKRENLATLFLLKEVLDLPLSKRRRRRQ